MSCTSGHISAGIGSERFSKASMTTTLSVALKDSLRTVNDVFNFGGG
jgi:hypothetical protein